MENENLYIFLDIIFRNGSVKRLARRGIDYNEIAAQTQIAIKDGLIAYSEQKIVLTEMGIELRKQLEINYKRTNQKEWIEKDLKNKVRQLEKDFIFLPRQNELTFRVLS
jgi:hypothetical protein